MLVNSQQATLLNQSINQSIPLQCGNDIKKASRGRCEVKEAEQLCDGDVSHSKPGTISAGMFLKVVSQKSEFRAKVQKQIIQERTEEV